MNDTQAQSLDIISSLRTDFGEIYDENFKFKDKTKLVNFNKELEKIGISSKLTPKEIELRLQQAYEELMKMPTNTTLTPEQLKDFGEQAAIQKQKYDETIKNQKEAVAKFKEAGEKRYQDQQKEKQTQELLNQFFKSKVMVVPTAEIPEVPLTKANKETLLAAEMAAKEDPATTKKIFEEKIQEALKKSEQEYKTISRETVEKSAVHLVEQLRSLPDHKNVDEIADSPKSLNTLSILNPLSDPNSEEMKMIIPNKEAREKFAKEVQTLMLVTEAERTVNVAGAKVILGESVAYSLYGTENLTDFKISSEEKDRDEGVEIDPQSIYDKATQISDFIKKVRSVRTTEEVTSTGLAYYPTYSYSGTAVTTRTASTLTKTLPAVGAIYGFKQGVILSQWARSGTPLLSAGNQNLVRLLTSQAGVQEIASASMVTFSNPIGFQLGKFSIGIATGTNQAAGTQIAVGGIRFGEKMVGAIAVKGGSQVAIVTGTQAGAQLAVGASTALTKVLTFIGGLSSWATAGLSLVGGYLLGKVIEKINWPKVKKWFQDNGPVLAGVAGLGALALGGPAVGGIVLLGGLAATGTLGVFAAGAFGVLGFIGRSVGIAIATPVIVTLLIIPPLVAFIMLVINNSAYVVPPSISNLLQNQDNLYVEVSKTAEPAGPFENTDLPLKIKYTITVKARRDALTNISFNHECNVIQKGSSQNCTAPKESPPASISPSSPYIYSYEAIYNSSYKDALVINTFTVTVDTGENKSQTSSGNATITIGNPPAECLKIDGNWPNSAKANMEWARGQIVSRFPSYVVKVCSAYPEPAGLPLRYNSSGYGSYWGWNHNDYIDFYQLGAKTKEDALYTLAHELGHSLAWRVKGIYSTYISSPGIKTEAPYCFYKDTINFNIDESMQEAIAFHVINPRCGNVQQKYPIHYKFIMNNVFN